MSNIITFLVKSMSCSGCSSTIKAALDRVAGVEQVDIQLQSKQVTVTFHPEQSSLEAIQQAIQSAGYPVDQVVSSH